LAITIYTLGHLTCRSTVTNAAGIIEVRIANATICLLGKGASSRLGAVCKDAFVFSAYVRVITRPVCDAALSLQFVNAAIVHTQVRGAGFTVVAFRVLEAAGYTWNKVGTVPRQALVIGTDVSVITIRGFRTTWLIGGGVGTGSIYTCIHRTDLPVLAVRVRSAAP